MPKEAKLAMLNRKGIVTNIEKDKVSIVPLPSEACLGCKESSCAKRDSVFIAHNPRRIELKIGETVVFGSSTRIQAIQGTIALFLPIVVAALSYIFISYFTLREGLRILSVLLGFFLSCSLIAYLNHRRHTGAYTQIYKVC